MRCRPEKPPENAAEIIKILKTKTADFASRGQDEAGLPKASPIIPKTTYFDTNLNTYCSES
jgi:hypothetical protein